MSFDLTPPAGLKDQLSQLDVIVLAAGKGTRFGSEATSKVLHAILGRPVLYYVLKAAQSLNPQRIYVVVEHHKEQIEAALFQWQAEFSSQLVPIAQGEPKGTGHAIQQVALKAPYPLAETVAIVSGDVPLLQPESLQAFKARFEQSQADFCLMSATVDQPTGYGRVCLDEEGLPLCIVEEKDADAPTREINLVNAGTYLVRWPAIHPLLQRLSDSNNAQGEFYWTDCVALARQQGLQVQHWLLPEAYEMQGINTRADLATCIALQNQLSQKRLMQQGVTFIAPDTCWVGPDVEIGADSVVHPGCMLEGKLRIGQHCAIGPYTLMSGSVSTGDFCTVMQSRVYDAQMGSHVWIGPYAHLKEAVTLADHVKIGNFVELKEASVGSHSFVSHLAYVGNADVGNHVNYGAGAITANYNHLTGEKMHTSIGNHVSVGSNAVLVAPLEIADHAAIAAGSVITHNVAAYDLAVARSRQTTVQGWVKKQLAKLLPASMIQKPVALTTPSVSSISQMSD